MQDIERIKYLKTVEKLSYREISKQTGLDRRTIKKWCNTKRYPEYKRGKSANIVKDKIFPYIKQWLEEDLLLKHQGKKKRIRPASTMHADLLRLNIRCSSASVRKILRQLKPEEVFIPLEYIPGEEMQVDWGELDVTFACKTTVRVNLFVATLPYSNARFVYPYLRADQMSFFDGHKKAFEFFGGIAAKITYDNLTSAVKKVLKLTNREENDKMIYFKEYYGIETNYCSPAKGNEKGSVENGVGFVKRRFLSGEFKVKNFNELAQYLTDRCQDELESINSKRNNSIKTLLLEEQKHFKSISDKDFDTSKTTLTRSTNTLFVSYDGVRYSIPSEYCRKQVSLKATPDMIFVYSGTKEIAKHFRTHKLLCKEVIIWQHYLPALLTKPRALDKAKCIMNANFPDIFSIFLEKLKIKQVNGNKEMVKILSLYKEYSLKNIFFAMEWCNETKSYSYDAVLLAIKQLTTVNTPKETIDKKYHQFNLPEPDLQKYNGLLGGAI